WVRPTQRSERTASSGSARGRQRPSNPCQGLSKASGTKACGGKRVRIKISNTYGEHPLLIGGAHIARRSSEADIDPASDRVLKFHGQASTKIPPRSIVVSDP